MTLAVLFPGQGSQYVGMGRDLFTSGPDILGDEADAILGWSLRDVCLEGPEETLTRTEHAQPALFAVAYALWEVFRDALPGEVAAAAGHSLGEYTALAAAEALGFAETLALVATRGKAMARSADLEASGMAALIGADETLANAIAGKRAADGGRLQVANLNAPGQVVVAGSTEDIRWVTENARELGVRRAIPLNVAGAFHSTFMAPAAAEIGESLASLEFAEPKFPVWSNTTARPHTRSGLADTLRSQVVSAVRFEESLRGMSSEGIDTFVHIGPGDVTAGMAKRTIDGAVVHVISSVGDIQRVTDALVTIG